MIRSNSDNKSFYYIIIIISILVWGVAKFLITDHNDNMYIASLSNTCINYACNAFVQMPYYFILKIFTYFQIFDTYLFLKIISILCFITTILVLKKIFNENKTFIIFICLVIINPILTSGANEIGNYTYTYLFLTLTIINIFKNKMPLLTGIFFAISIGFKLSSLIFLPMAFFWKTKKDFTLMSLGLAIGLFPILFWVDDYFYLNNFLFHSELTANQRDSNFSYFDVFQHLQTISNIFSIQFIRIKMFLFNLLLLFLIFLKLRELNWTKIKFNYENIFVITLLICCILVPLSAKVAVNQYLIPLNIVISIIVAKFFYLNGRIVYLIIFFSILINSHSIYDVSSKQISSINIYKIRKKISDNITEGIFSNNIYSYSGTLTSFISSFKNYQDSGIFYPRLGNVINSYDYSFNEYYYKSIYPHENIKSLPNQLVVGEYNHNNYYINLEKKLIESFIDNYDTVKKIYLGNLGNKKIYLYKGTN